jgi:hypothetical protein
MAGADENAVGRAGTKTVCIRRRLCRPGDGSPVLRFKIAVTVTRLG